VSNLHTFPCLISQVLCLNAIVANSYPFLPPNLLYALFDDFGLMDDNSRLRVVTAAAAHTNHVLRVATIIRPNLSSMLSFNLTPPHDLFHDMLPDSDDDELDIPDHLLNPSHPTLPQTHTPQIMGNNNENSHPNLWN
jgi:hypothetical protein